MLMSFFAVFCFILLTHLLINGLFMGLFHLLFNAIFIGVVIIGAFAYPAITLVIALLYGLDYICKARPETQAQRQDRIETERLVKEYEQKEGAK